MQKKGDALRRALFRFLPFETYLLVLSRLFFWSYKKGKLKDDPIYKYHHYLPEHIKKGHVVIDIGANLGYFTRLFSDWVGPSGEVHAFEPIRPIFNVLKKNTQSRSNVSLNHFALGAENKKIKLGNNTRKHLGFISSGEHFVIDNPDGKTADDEFPAEMKDVKEVFKPFQKIDFIKCDVEGYEKVIIPLLENTIKKHQPKVLIETSGENRKKILDIFKSLNYNAFVLENGELTEAEKAKKEDDILFVPIS